MNDMSNIRLCNSDWLYTAYRCRHFRAWCGINKTHRIELGLWFRVFSKSTWYCVGVILSRLRSEQISCVYPWVGPPTFSWWKPEEYESGWMEMLRYLVYEGLVHIGNVFLHFFSLCVVVLFSIHAVFSWAFKCSQMICSLLSNHRWWA